MARLLQLAPLYGTFVAEIPAHIAGMTLFVAKIGNLWRVCGNFRNFFCQQALMYPS